MSNFLEQVHKKLIVSCQALEHEPLHSSYIMSRMAYAAMLGGAAGIRANTVEDITAIKETVNLPVIGIIKHVYGDCPVFITPTEREVDALVSCGTEVIALDATSRPVFPCRNCLPRSAGNIPASSSWRTAPPTRTRPRPGTWDLTSWELPCADIPGRRPEWRYRTWI